MNAYIVNSFQFIPDFARKSVCGKTMSVVCFSIAPQYRSKGIATAFLERVIADAKASRFDIELFAWSEKTKPICASTQAFYKSVGFVVEKEHLNLWAQDIITVKMKKSW